MNYLSRGIVAFASSLLLIGTISAEVQFTIKQSGNDIMLEYPSDTNSYYIIWSGTLDGGFSEPLDIALGSGTLQGLIDSGILLMPQQSGFYKLEKILKSESFDSDNDGISDVDELAHSFLDPFNASDALNDFDDDGFSNADELSLFRTDPSISNSIVSPPQIMGLSLQSAKDTLQIASLKIGTISVVETVHFPAVAVLSPELSPFDALPEGAAVDVTLSLPADPNRFINPAIFYDSPDQIPTSQAESNAAIAYYQAIDPLNEKTTLSDWITANGFGTAGGTEAYAAYFNEADLGFGREMYMRQDSERIAFYVTNYKTANDAADGEPIDLATVCMEFSPHPVAGGDPYVKFYTYNGRNPDPAGRADPNVPAEARMLGIDLDGRGAKMQPHMCMTCHGGLPRELENGVYPDFGRTDARFIPFDIDSFVYPTQPGYSRAAQENQFKVLNKAVLDSIPEAKAFPVTKTVPIPDNDIFGINVTNTVDGLPGIIADVNFSIDGIGPCSSDSTDQNNGLNHSWIGDLEIWLSSPEGTTILLLDRNAENSSNICDANFDDEATTNVLSWTSLMAPFTGRWSPVQALSAFDGEDPNGDWVLNIRDRAEWDMGAVNQWSLHIKSTEKTGAVAELIEGWYGGETCPSNFNEGFIPTGWLTNTASIAEGGDEVYSEVVARTCRACHVMLTDRRPDLDFNSFKDFSDRRAQIEAYVYDQGLMPMAKRTFDKFWLSADPSQADVLAHWIDYPGRFSFVAGSPQPIPDFGTGGALTNTVMVSGFSETIDDLDFSFDGLACSRIPGDVSNGLTHTYISDIQVTLISPEGTSVKILDRIGEDGMNICSLRLDDEAPGAIDSVTAAQAPFVGSWKPSNPLSLFDGESPTGTWTLVVEDLAGADTGSLQQWSLHFNSLGLTKGPGGPIAAFSAPSSATNNQIAVLNASESMFADTYAWTLISSPVGSSAVISNDTAQTAFLKVDHEGVFTVRLTIENLFGKESAVRSILVENQTPSVSVSADESVKLFPVPFQLTGVVSDDGLPKVPGKLTYQWSKAQGSGDARFSNPTNTETSVSFSVPDEYRLCLLVTDGAVSNFSEVTVNSEDTLVAVGDVGNPADTNGFGQVNEEYQISKYELTIGQYAAFLNSVASSDPLALYEKNDDAITNTPGIVRSGSDGSYTYTAQSGMEDLPVAAIRFADAVRYVNWLHNGATNGASTETGSYDLVGGGVFPSNIGTVTRTPDARYWIPSVDEWYKAAYYQPFTGGGDVDDYWLYAGQSNVLNAAVPPGIRPAANFDFINSTSTPVGAYTNTLSYYMTYDQSGNVWEMTDSVRSLGGGSFGRVMRGGGRANSLSLQRADYSGFAISVSTSFFSLDAQYGVRIAGSANLADGNQSPEVNAGASTNLTRVTLPVDNMLFGTVSDDGFPTNGVLTSTWTKFSGPGLVEFPGGANNTNTTARFHEHGTYILRLEGNDGERSSFDFVTNTVLVSFEQDIVPMLTDLNPGTLTCLECHNGNPGQGLLSFGPNGTTLSACADIYGQLDPDTHPTRVNLADPENSRFLTYPAEGGGSMGSVTNFNMGSTKYNKILRWIEQGAVNDCP